MNLPRPFLNRPNPFQPAITFFTNSFKTPNRPASKSIDSLDGDELHLSAEAERLSTSRYAAHSRTSSGGAESSTSGIPLIDFSRTPSPSSYNFRTRSATQSEDEDDSIPISLRPLVAEAAAGGSIKWGRAWRDGGLGAFLFGTWAGYQAYVILLVIWSIGTGICLVSLNRIILWSGVYKFPYPLTATWIQLWFTHLFLLFGASLSRMFAQPLRRVALSALVAPAHSPNSKVSSQRAIGRFTLNPFRIITHLTGSSGGIAGGGVFEFDKPTAWAVMPLAVVFVGRVLLSNISFAYAALPLYNLSRIGVLPLTLIFTATITRSTHSISTLSSALTAWLNLLIASIGRFGRVTWEGIVAGVFSTLFVCLYPILLDRTHKLLTAAQVPQGDVLTSFAPAHSGTSAVDASGTKQETRAYYQVLHYTSILSLALLFPMVLISGELPNIFRNCYFLDVPWFWFVCICGGFASWTVFGSTLALVRATSPLTATFVSIPQAAFHLVIFSGGRLPVHSWVGVALCWAGSCWYTLVRREEGRRGEKRRLEGR